MTKEIKNPQAFPMDYTHEGYSKGMSLRDYFAAKAMQAMLTNETIIGMSNDVVKNTERTRSEWISDQSYRFADAMLKQRVK